MSLEGYNYLVKSPNQLKPTIYSVKLKSSIIRSNMYSSGIKRNRLH